MKQMNEKTCKPVYLNPYYENRFVSYLETIREFSGFYQEILLGCLKYRASAGSPINYSAKRIKDPFKTKIGPVTTIEYEGTTANILMSAGIIHIESGGIMAPVISAPANLPKTKKEKFLKAVVRTFIEDPENIFRYVKPAYIPGRFSFPWTTIPAEVPA